jgi:hypothetical protein
MVEKDIIIVPLSTMSIEPSLGNWTDEAVRLSMECTLDPDIVDLLPLSGVVDMLRGGVFLEISMFRKATITSSGVHTSL